MFENIYFWSKSGKDVDIQKSFYNLELYSKKIGNKNLGLKTKNNTFRRVRFDVDFIKIVWDRRRSKILLSVDLEIVCKVMNWQTPCILENFELN